MKLFGYKKWYKEQVEGQKFKKKVKLKKENYQILIENNNNEIPDNTFVDELKKYKTSKNLKLDSKKVLIGRKFSKDNILFKIKKDKEFRNVSILKQSEQLGKFNKENNTSKSTPFTRNNYESIISNDYEAEFINVDTEFKKIKIFIFNNENEYNSSKELYKILYRVNDIEENEIREKLYEKCKEINKDIFTILTALIFKKCDKRNFIEYYIQEIYINSINKILNKFKELKDICSGNENLYKELKFYLNADKNNYKVSDIKKIFVSKLENYFLYDVELKQEDISEFLVKEAVFYDILKRQEKVKYNEDSWIKTYIKNDKHNSYLKEDNNKDKDFLEKIKKSEKIETIQKLLKEDIQGIMDDIFKLYKLDSLIEKLSEEKINDTNLFGVYKTYYNENVKLKVETYLKTGNEEKDSCKKLIAKIIYRYLKGRIEKIITYRCKNKLNDIFKEDVLKNKITKKVEQYIIENLIYLGKVRLLNEEKKNLNDKNIAKEFEIFSIKEELELEFLNFVSATNLKLNELFKNKQNEKAVFDYFANTKEKIDIHFKSLDVAKSETILKNRINIEIDNFKTYLEIMTSVRSGIVHRGNSPKSNNSEGNISIFDYYKTSNDLKIDNENVIKKINELKISDEEICKNLNFDILFNNEKMKSIIGKINNTTIGKTNMIYFPNYSKLVPKIENKLRDSVSFKDINDMEFSILKNAFIYLNKILYYKIISNWEEDKEAEYKNAQIRASKGDKKAIKKFQNKFIDEYLDKIKEEYKDLFNFDYLKNIEVKISEANGERNLDKSCILNSELKNIEIKNDFEYIIIVSALIMDDNTYINKFRNRLFSTFTALETMDSDIENLKDIENLIEILDIIISINKGKRDYRNELLLSSNDRIERVKKEIENLKTEIQNIILTKEDYIHIIESCKDKLFSNNKNLLNSIKKVCNEEKTLFIDLFDERDNKVIQEYFNKNSISKENIGAVIAFNKEIQNIKTQINSNKLYELLSTSSQKNVDNLLRKEQLLFDKEKLVLELESSKEILNKYIEEMEEITKNDKKGLRKFEKIYYQENNALIYKKNLFYYINQDSFRKIYDNFLKEDLENVSTSEIKNNTKIVEKINNVNRVLTDINKYIHSFSKEYKENFKQNLDIFFEKRKYKGIESFEEFKNIYEEIKKYKEDKDIVEMTIVGKILNYLVEISWKLSMQISRIERDIDYLYNGIISLDSTKGENDNKEAVSRLEKVLIFCKQNDKNNNLFESLETLKKDLKTEKKSQENSTRNIVAHFELLQNPFNYINLKEIIDKVSELSEYRNKYNNAVYNMCFEVFKKDFELDYEKLKKKFTLSNNDKNIDVFKIKDILAPRKISILEIETNETLLEKVKKLFEYKGN